MTISDFVIEGVETAGPSTSVEALAMQMADAGVGSIVIEEDMEPIGIVTDRDLAVRVNARGRDGAETTAGDVMTADPVTVPLDAGLLEVTRLLRHRGVRRLPVVEDDGTLAGILTLDDVMQVLVQELDNLGRVIELESTPY
jgi:CBS domain-containing protein